MKKEDFPYPLVTVGGMIIASDGEILLVQSKKWPNVYSFPGGKVELGETRVDAFIREIKEETGIRLNSATFALTQESIFSKEFWVHNKHFVMNDYLGHLPSNQSKQDVVLNNEHSSYQWITPTEALKLPLSQPTKNLINWYLANEKTNKQ